MVFFYESQGVPSKILLSLFFVFLLLALFLSHNRGAWVALLVQVLVFTFLKVQVKWVKWLLICVSLGSLLMVGERIINTEAPILMDVPFGDLGSMKIRLETWKIGLVQILERPFMGYGYGFDTFPMVNPSIQVRGRTLPLLDMHLHNVFLSKAYEVGSVGLVLFMTIFWMIGKLAYNGFQQGVHTFVGNLGFCVFLLLVGIVARNMFDNMLVGTLGYLFWLLTGLYFASRLDMQQAKGVTALQRS